MRITILGEGIFGSTMASCFSKRGHVVVFNEADSSDVIFVCVTSNMVLPSLLKLQKEITDQKIIICSKGFAGDGRLISEALKKFFKNDIFFLYGPTLADELTKGVPSGMVFAGGAGKDALKKEIESDRKSVV